MHILFRYPYLVRPVLCAGDDLRSGRDCVRGRRSHRRGILPDGRRVRFLLNYSEEEQRAVDQTGLDLLTNRHFSTGDALTLPPWGATILV